MMTNMKKLMFLSMLCGAIMLVSCERTNVASEQTHVFENDLFVEPVQSDFTNGKDTFQLYNIVLSLKLNFDSVWYRQLPFYMSYVSPNGDSVMIPIAIALPYEPATEANTKPSKPTTDSAWVFEETIFRANKMAEGRNTFYIAPATNNDTLLGISAITLRIEKAN